MLEEQNSDGFPSHSGDQFPLHGFLYHQPHSPASAALRWVTTDHGDDALLLAIVQNLRRARPLLFVELTFQAAFLVAMANLANRLGGKGMTEEIRGALTPWASLESATARSMTRTCCTPPLSSSRKVFRSWFVTSIRRAGRAIPQVCAKTFLNGIVLLELLQAVADLVAPSLCLRQLCLPSYHSL